MMARSWALPVIAGLGMLCATVMIGMLDQLHSIPSELEQTSNSGRESMLHLLTPHERALFRAQQAKQQQHGVTENMLDSWSNFAKEHPQPQPRRVAAAAARSSPSPVVNGMRQQDPHLISAPRQILRSNTQPQMLGAWPYQHPEQRGAAKLDPLGQAIHDSDPEERGHIKHAILNALNEPNAVQTNNVDDQGREQYSEENPPCYTPEDCDRFARAHGYWGEHPSKLPTYDHDTLQLLGAMQKQDHMMLDIKKHNERLAGMGSKAPKLPAVTCGQQCFSARGVWCCRLHEVAIPPFPHPGSLAGYDTSRK